MMDSETNPFPAWHYVRGFRKLPGVPLTVHPLPWGQA